jgi:hypothetical protein
MNGDLAQLIWLAAHGNHFFNSGEELSEYATVYEGVWGMRFDGVRRSQSGAAVGSSRPNEWLSQLAASGVKHLGIDALAQLDSSDPGSLPDHIAAAFVEGHRASLIATGDLRAERWTAKWMRRSGEPPADNRVWVVLYSGVDDERCKRLVHSTPEAAMSLLVSSLRSALQFATSQNLPMWAEVFEEALRLADDERPEVPYYPDLLPSGTDPFRVRLIASACKGYVFRGMGSWNDVGYDDGAEAEYTSVTTELYAAVMTAIDAGVNDSE